MNEILIANHLQQILSPKLYAHCLGVVEVAGALAQARRCDVEKTRIAAWLHDCAREWEPDELLMFAKKYDIPIDEYAWRQPELLHPPVGAELAKRLGVKDPQVISAILNHTLGAPGMPIIDQIVYVADKIEPNRIYTAVEDLRYFAHHDFQKALRLVTASTVSYVLGKEQIVHPRAITYWNYLVQNTTKEV